MDKVELGNAEDAFSRGGNRLCFIDPRDRTRCIKVLRPDRTPEIRRQQKGFPKTLRSLESFNENLEEYKVWTGIEKNIGNEAFELITRCYGFVDTNLGEGLVMDLVCDSDHKISKTLKQYLWEVGLTPEISESVQRFSKAWVSLAMPSKKLLLHNMLLKQHASGSFQIKVVDGLGWASLLPIGKFIKSYARHQSKRKISDLWVTIAELDNKKKSGKDFGYHGWMTESQRIKNQND